MKNRLNQFWLVLKNSFKGWGQDQATTLSAALAYYTVFSIAPLVLIAIAITGIFYGEDATRGELFKQMDGLIGIDAAKAIQSIVEASSVKKTGVIATCIGVVTLLIGATSVFSQLQFTLNQIWKVKSKPKSGFKTILYQRLLSFSVILVIAFLLLVSLLASTILSAGSTFASAHLPGGVFIWQVLNEVVSLVGTSFLFASIYKILPGVQLSWKNVATGGIITAFLFTIGKSLIGFYLGHSGISSTFGAAGSLVLVLLWTFYSSAILIFGAEYTRFNSYQSKAKPLLKEGILWLQEETLSH